MSAAIGIAIALLVIASSGFLAVALTRARKLRAAAARLDSLRGTEASVGYTCMVELDGEPFDVVQRRIRPGHISCPSGDLVNGDLHVVLPTPSTSATNWPRAALHVALLATLATACGPSIIVIEDGSGDGDRPADMPSCVGDLGCACEADGWCDGELVCDGASGVCEEPCESYPMIECEGSGLCWAWLPGWSSWAQYGGSGIFDGFEPVDLLPYAECYQVIDSDAHMCIVEVDCVRLMGRPAAEILTIESTCAEPGPWESIAGTNTQCFGVIDDVAVLLDTDH